MDAISEAIMRSQQFRGPLVHEREVREIAGGLMQAMEQGQLDSNDLRALADCLETGVRKRSKLKAV